MRQLTLLCITAAIFLSIAKADSRKPNVLFFLTDDQDLLMGSLDYMPKLREHVAEQGAQVEYFFAATPVCCPSRSEIQTGRLIHNLGVTNNSVAGNCAGEQWRLGPEQDNMGYYVNEQGYRTGYMGKYLNCYGSDGAAGGIEHVPRGWDTWVGLKGNSVYYNYTLSVDGVAEQHGDDYATDYLPDLLVNRSIKFLEQDTETPFFLTISTPSCHESAEPAPQYADMFDGVGTPRHPGWNEHVTDRHWLVSRAGIDGPMNSTMVAFSDLLYRRRLLTLQSVDDAVERVLTLLADQGRLGDTYVIYTSDHGYHTGQFGLALDKRQPYELDLRVPMLVRGPGIPAGSLVGRGGEGATAGFGANIDIAPTILDMVGAPIPMAMDGVSLLPLLRGFKPGADQSAPTLAGSSLAATAAVTATPTGNPTPTTGTGTSTGTGTPPVFGRTALLIEYHGEGGPAKYSNCGAYNRDPAYDGLSCAMRTPAEFKFPPFYTDGDWCSCQDSSNSTYACLRVLGADAHLHQLLYGGNGSATGGNRDRRDLSHHHSLSAAADTALSAAVDGDVVRGGMGGSSDVVNLQYCEFADDDHMVEFYDVAQDPWNLINAAKTLSPELRRELSRRLSAIRSCEGHTCYSS